MTQATPPGEKQGATDWQTPIVATDVDPGKPMGGLVPKTLPPDQVLNRSPDHESAVPMMPIEPLPGTREAEPSLSNPVSSLLDAQAKSQVEILEGMGGQPVADPAAGSPPSTSLQPGSVPVPPPEDPQPLVPQLADPPVSKVAPASEQDLAAIRGLAGTEVVQRAPSQSIANHPGLSQADLEKLVRPQYLEPRVVDSLTLLRINWSTLPMHVRQDIVARVQARIASAVEAGDATDFATKLYQLSGGNWSSSKRMAIWVGLMAAHTAWEVIADA